MPHSSGCRCLWHGGSRLSCWMTSLTTRSASSRMTPNRTSHDGSLSDRNGSRACAACCFCGVLVYAYMLIPANGLHPKGLHTAKQSPVRMPLRPPPSSDSSAVLRSCSGFCVLPLTKSAFFTITRPCLGKMCSLLCAAHAGTMGATKILVR